MNNQLVFGTAIGLILGAAIGFFTANAIIGISVGIAMALGFSGLLGRMLGARPTGRGHSPEPKERT